MLMLSWFVITQDGQLKMVMVITQPVKAQYW